MRSNTYIYRGYTRPGLMNSLSVSHLDAGLLLGLALVAFELFSFETARFALSDLLGTVSFAGLRWATILAVAFCAIDFAGLLRFFTLQQEKGDRAEAWYWMAIWLLGATLHALLAWYAVSITLASAAAGNSWLDSTQLLEVAPFAVAALTWLTRILFIGAFTLAKGDLFDQAMSRPVRKHAPVNSQRSQFTSPRAAPAPANSPTLSGTNHFGNGRRAGKSTNSKSQGFHNQGRHPKAGQLKPIWVGF